MKNRGKNLMYTSSRSIGSPYSWNSWEISRKENRGDSLDLIQDVRKVEVLRKYPGWQLVQMGPSMQVRQLGNVQKTHPVIAKLMKIYHFSSQNKYQEHILCTSVHPNKSSSWESYMERNIAWLFLYYQSTCWHVFIMIINASVANRSIVTKWAIRDEWTGYAVFFRQSFRLNK